MEAVTFDTHEFVKRLTKAGMPEPQAEILAEEQSRLIQERLATKKDLKELEVTLRRDFKEIEAALQEKLKALENILELKLKALEDNLELKLKTLEDTLKRDIKEMEQKLTIKLGAFMGISITVLAVLFALLTTSLS